MPEYLSPGVYIEEISTGPKPIEGVSTSTAAFLGMTERGPEPPQFITSWLDYQRWYGGYVPDSSYLAYAVQGFFENGGQRCFVGRIIAGQAVGTSGQVGEIIVRAIGRGIWGNNIMISVEDATQKTADRDWFRIKIKYNDIEEDYDNLTERVGASNNVITVINTASRLVRVAWVNDPVRPPNQGPELFGDNGDDFGDVTATDYKGDLDADGIPDERLGRGRGLEALATIDEINLLVVPDETRNNMSQITRDVISQCELLKDRFAIVSAVQSAGAVQNIGHQDTSYAAFYYPWIRVYDPSINDLKLIPPTGHIAGIFARTDIERGVHKAPANEVVRGAVNMQFPVTKGVQAILNPKGINCIRDFRSDGRGIRLWGARTMSSDGEWKYVNVRRLFLFVEESIDEGTQWVVFEPNDEPTWAKVRRSISNFLISVWRSGGLMGMTQDEAFFVKCDRTTMTQDDIDNGRLICYIGIAPVKPAEFVIFRISQKTIETAA